MGLRHIEALEQNGVELTAVHDDDPARLNSVVSRLHTKVQGYQNAAEMIRIHEPTHWAIATNTSGRFELCRLALEASIKFVLAEKPPFSSLSQATAIVELSQRYPKTNLGFNFCERYSPFSLLINEWISGGSLWGLEYVTFGGGNFGLAANGIHFIDLFQQVLQKELDSVSFARDIETESNPRGEHLVDLSGRFLGSTATSQILTMNTSPRMKHGISSIWVFEEGIVSVDLLGGQIIRSTRGTEALGQPSFKYGLSGVTEIHPLAESDIIKQTKQVWRKVEEGCAFVGPVEAHQLTSVMSACVASSLQSGEVISTSDPRLVELRTNWI